MKWNYLIVFAVTLILLVTYSCAQPPAEVPPSTPTPTPKPTPPPAITGLVAANAYDGRVNLWWDKSAIEDFDHYNIYVNKAEMVDITGIKPILQIKDVGTRVYQVAGLEMGTKYYFAVTAVDKNGNEDKRVVSVKAISTPMPRGTSEPHLHVDVYRSDRAWASTTLFGVNYNPDRPRIIEVNMLGETIWEYLVPEDLGRPDKPHLGLNPGFDVELLPNNNILFVSPGKGIYEIDRKGNVVWSYLDKKVSHDVDRLPSGNTLVVFGDYDQIDDAQVKEINPKGDLVWAWYAKDHFYKLPYKDIYWDGWAHTNAAQRLPNGNTLISPRNFNLVIEVDPKGAVVRTIGEGILGNPHDPGILPNGNLLSMTTMPGESPQAPPFRAVEIDPKTGQVVWQFVPSRGVTLPPNRGADRLPNGNTLIIGATAIMEVTPRGEIVWQLRLKDVTIEPGQAPARGFYTAERIGIQK